MAAKASQAGCRVIEAVRWVGTVNLYTRVVTVRAGLGCTVLQGSEVSAGSSTNAC